MERAEQDRRKKREEVKYNHAPFSWRVKMTDTLSAMQEEQQYCCE
jgi:hypothetical protein